MHLSDKRIVSAQLDRTPRQPWRVGARCAYGYPQVIISPSLLEDGSRFPNWAYLTCPFLSHKTADFESAALHVEYATRAQNDATFADSLRVLDGQVRAMRLAESGGEDVCSDVGLAGQRSPLGVKCLHAHIAYALVDLDDPIGLELLAETGVDCDACECEALAQDGV